MTYSEFIDSIASQVRVYDNRDDLANAVFEAVCGADQDELPSHVDYSDDWRHSGHHNNWWTDRNAPDFADASALGDWDGMSLASVQELCQVVMNTVIERDGEPE